MTERRLIIGQYLLQCILEHCLEEKPYEACGILTGRGSQVLQAYATDNAKRSPVFFEVEGEQQERVFREMEERGEELLAIYHSHPTAPALPSLNDVNQAVHFPQAIRVIISLNGPTAVRAFHIQNGKVKDVMIAIFSDAGGTFHDLRRAAQQ
jgi:proteasome lid subunit RPN8/RPN11